MKVFYTDTFVLPLPPRHRFPMAKYARLRERVEAEGIVPRESLQIPDAARRDALELAHAPDYVARVLDGTLSKKEIREIGFPWSHALVERSLRSCGGTIDACRAALTTPARVAVNLAGGTHHASRARGAGYCVFNDAAVAARVMQAERRTDAVLIVDCDVHQGDGTARIFADDASVFTFSIHAARNFPFEKPESDLDVALPDQTGDEAYLAALERGLTRAIAAAGSGARLAIYVAGADPYDGDKLGRLAVSKQGLARRDRLVLDLCGRAGLAVAVSMAGGYARDVDDIVDIHAETVRQCSYRGHAARARGTSTGDPDAP